MKFNTKDVQFTDVDGNPLLINDIHKTVANILFNNAQSIDVHEAAIALNKDEEIEISESAKAEIIAIVEQAPLYMFVKKPLVDYLKNLKDGERVILP